jgi:hypothetical protein
MAFATLGFGVRFNLFFLNNTILLVDFLLKLLLAIF